jgi:hypothetical protein
MAVDVVLRRGWAAQLATNRYELPAQQIDELVIHYSSMDSERRTSHAECAGVVRSIQRYHQVTKGWADIAYNWLVCQHGGVYEGRGWGVMSAATYGHNSHTQAVCFLGGDKAGRDDVTAGGRAALAHVIREFQKRYPGEIVGHRDRVNTSCPGDELYAWIGVKGWEALDPALRPWPIPIPRWFWQWVAWWRTRYTQYPAGTLGYLQWMRDRPAGVPIRIPKWAWRRLEAMGGRNP